MRTQGNEQFEYLIKKLTNNINALQEELEDKTRTIQDLRDLNGFLRYNLLTSKAFNSEIEDFGQVLKAVTYPFLN